MSLESVRASDQISDKIKEYLQQPLYIIKMSLRGFRWVEPYKHAFKFAILAILEAKNFSVVRGINIPVVEEAFSSILRQQCSGLWIDKQMMKSFLQMYNLSASIKDIE